MQVRDEREGGANQVDVGRAVLIKKLLVVMTIIITTITKIIRDYI